MNTIPGVNGKCYFFHLPQRDGFDILKRGAFNDIIRNACVDLFTIGVDRHDGPLSVDGAVLASGTEDISKGAVVRSGDVWSQSVQDGLIVV